MTFPRHIWQQIKNISVETLIAALEKDGWEEDSKQGAVRPFVKGRLRVTIHFHPHKTYSPKLLKGLLSAIGWSVVDLERLGLVKKAKKRPR